MNVYPICQSPPWMPATARAEQGLKWEPESQISHIGGRDPLSESSLLLARVQVSRKLDLGVKQT